MHTLVNSKGEVDFNRVIPMPKALNVDWSSSAMNLYQALYGTDDDVQQLLSISWIKDDKVTNREELIAYFKQKYPNDIRLAKRYKHNLDKYGYITWYEWSLANWGTKWNADTIEVTPIQSGYLVRFLTAWNPPWPIVFKLAEMFPKVKIRFDFEEPGLGIYGSYVLENGIVYGMEEEWQSLEEFRNQYGNLRKRIINY
jgi:hypothetical protein